MPEAVYLMCAVTSALCSAALLRTYRQRRARLLLWSCLCFIGLALNNTLLFVDLVVTGPAIDLSALRAAVSALALVTLVAGMVWEAR